MINRVILVGRLTKDLELRKTPSGASVVSFTVACDRRFKQDNQPTADFINCVAWNKVADLMSQYLHKGSLIGVEGRIQTRTYDGQDGKRVYVTEVIADSVQFLEPKGSNGSQNNYNAEAFSNNESTQTFSPNVPDTNAFESEFDSNDTLDIASDDLPF